MSGGSGVGAERLRVKNTGVPMKVALPLAVFTACFLSAGIASAAESSAAFIEEVQPLLKTYCFSCHGPDLQVANIRLDDLSANLVEDRRDAEIWRNTLHKLRRGEMPPKGSPQPGSAERDHVVGVLKAVVDRAMEQRRSTDGRTVLRRLNRTEYQNTMTDLLGYEMDYARDIPPDSLSRDGFRNNGSSLRMTAMQLEYYLEGRAQGNGAGHRRPAAAGIEVLLLPFDEEQPDKWLLPSRADRQERRQPHRRLPGPHADLLPRGRRVPGAVTAAAEFKPGKGPPIMQVSVGFRPDTEILFKTMGEVELTSEEPQTFEFRGHMENFPQAGVAGRASIPAWSSA